MQVKFIANSSLPFRILAHKGLADLLKMACSAPSTPQLLNPITARRRLEKMVKDEQNKILSTLPPKAKLSLALDCWTSPFKQAFMAVTGYFVDQDWNYREILLGFEPLHGAHSGANLSTVLFDLLQQYGSDMGNRVLAITTDNASNNGTLVDTFQDSVDLLGSLGLPDEPLPDAIVIRIPCLAHVIQLSLNQLLGFVKAGPTNDSTDKVWLKTHDTSLDKSKSEQGIIYTLAKVTSISITMPLSIQPFVQPFVSTTVLTSFFNPY